MEDINNIVIIQIYLEQMLFQNDKKLKKTADIQPFFIFRF